MGAGACKGRKSRDEEIRGEQGEEAGMGASKVEAGTGKETQARVTRRCKPNVAHVSKEVLKPWLACLPAQRSTHQPMSPPIMPCRACSFACMPHP